MPMIRGIGRLPTTPPPPIAIPAPLPPDYTPERLIDWQGVTLEYYQDESGVWHDKDGRPRPRSVALEWQGSRALQRCNDGRRALGWEPLDPYEYEMFSDRAFHPVAEYNDFPVDRHRSRPRFTVPEGPWWYRLWVWSVVHLCG